MSLPLSGNLPEWDANGFLQLQKTLSDTYGSSGESPRKINRNKHIRHTIMESCVSGGGLSGYTCFFNMV